MVYAIERSIDPMLAMKVVFEGKSEEVVESFKSQVSWIDYIQFQMRVDSAKINAIGLSWCTLDEFSNKVSKDEPRYHLYRYIHTTENGIRNSIGKNLVFYILKVIFRSSPSHRFYDRYNFLFLQSLFWQPHTMVSHRNPE